MKLLTLILILFFSPLFLVGQITDFENLGEKNRIEYLKNKTKRARKFLKSIEYLPVKNKPPKKVGLYTFKSEKVTAYCSLDIYSDIIESGKITLDDIWKEFGKDLNLACSKIIKTEKGDSIAESIYNGNLRKINIISFNRLVKLDRDKERCFYINIAVEDGYVGGFTVLFLFLRNPNATKTTEMNTFILNVTEYKLIYSNSEI